MIFFSSSNSYVREMSTSADRLLKLSWTNRMSCFFFCMSVKKVSRVSCSLTFSSSLRNSSSACRASVFSLSLNTKLSIYYFGFAGHRLPPLRSFRWARALKWSDWATPPQPYHRSYPHKARRLDPKHWVILPPPT